MKLYPASAIQQLEFDKIRNMLAGYCKTEYSREKALELPIQTKKENIDLLLGQTHEFALLIQSGLGFPDETINISRELRLLSIPGALLTGEQFMQIRKLAVHMQKIFRWFDEERRLAYPWLTKLIADSWYEKSIIAMIDAVIEENGMVKDNASEELYNIRIALHKKRNEHRRLFDRIVSRLNKQGYLAEIEESFINGRRVLAVFAEQKRMVKGILQGESDSRRTSFIEPEETMELNNQIYSLENAETREVNRILMALTAELSVWSELLNAYHDIVGEFDFTRAKALLGQQYNGHAPLVVDKASVKLINACHPLLFIYNKIAGKTTVPVNIELNDKNRILVISGPNAGGKTVTMKTWGLLQMMVQSGLLVSCNPDSEFGIFRQLMIHIGDTQSLEFELSTYSSHLLNMKYFMENANGKTLFFIDELGSGSDPNLGGAFAEVIMEELARKHAMGIVTTHYLNLKVMASKVPGIINGAMGFDEKNLQPLYRLIIGKPGSSYTFAIAERIGLHPSLINKARKLVDEDHFSLDKLLNRTEQDLQDIDKNKKELNRLIKENERLKKEMESVLDKELHDQHVEILKQRNQLSEERLAYLKDLERKLKSLVVEWKKTENKAQVVKMMQALLFGQPEKKSVMRKEKKLEDKFEEVGEELSIGARVKMRNSRQVGTVKELRGKKTIIQIGSIPITVDTKELVVVREK